MRQNWIPNLIRLDVTMDKGMISLGKYTLPKMPALAVNVAAVPVKQAWK